MSYRIEYGTAVPLKYQRKKRKSHARTLTALSGLLFALAVGQFWPEGRQVLRRYLLPGEPSATEWAFSQMMSDLTHGIALEDAVVAFCQQIIDNGTQE